MFTVRPFEARTLSWWYDERDSIDLSPVYQRKGGIWSPFDKAYLINSILNGFDVPKLYLADFTYVNTPLNEKSRPYAVIDGRQRLEAIFGFFSNSFPLNRDFQLFDQINLQLAGLGYKDLKVNHPKIASKLENFNLSVMSVITDDEAKISELFVRLNKNRPLSGAEIRNAMTGELPRMVRRSLNTAFSAIVLLFPHCEARIRTRQRSCFWWSSAVALWKQRRPNWIGSSRKERNPKRMIWSERLNAFCGFSTKCPMCLSSVTFYCGLKGRSLYTIGL